MLSDKSKINISRLITLWMVLATRHRVGLSKFDESAHADVIDRIIEELSQDGNRRSTYFEVALRYQPMRLVRGAAPSDVLAESKSLLESAAGIAGVDFSVLTALLTSRTILLKSRFSIRSPSCFTGVLRRRKGRERLLRRFLKEVES